MILCPTLLYAQLSALTRGGVEKLSACNCGISQSQLCKSLHTGLPMLLTTPPLSCAVLDQRLPFVYNNRFCESFQVYLSRAPSLIEFCPITLRYSPSCGEYLKVLGRDCLVRATPQSMLASGFVAMCADEP